MRKRMLILTAAVSAALVFATGCSKGDKEVGTSAVESSVESSAETDGTKEQDVKETDDMEMDSEETTENVGEAENVSDGAEVDREPLKIWGMITEVTDSTITVDNQSGVSSEGEIIFHVDPEYTYVIDSTTGFPVSGEGIQLGKFEAYLGPAMTMSLPPQTTPYVVIVNIPEDSKAAQYVIAAGAIEETEGGKVLKAADGSEYKLAEQVEILPYLTRNIVALEDIEENSRCLVWLNAEDCVEKIVLFGE